MSKSLLASTSLAVVIIGGRGFSQPNAPTSPNIPCSPAPTGAQYNDTVVSTPNGEGFFKLLDGAQMANGSTPRGWWQSCMGADGGPAIFRVDPSIPGGAIYSTQNGNNGGVLMTNKVFTDYELVFDFWPDFGNDGGIFHRTSANGRCYQTVLDYIGGASLGGTWGEGGYIGRDQRPFSFGANESTITISTDPNFGWTNFTRRQNPASFGCPATGCLQADFRRGWSMNDWNQIRIKFYAGENTSTNVHMSSYFRRIGATPWIPVSKDTTLNYATPAGFIGLQVHGGGRFGGPRGTWYKRMLWRPLNVSGVPLVNGAPAPNLMDPVLPEVVKIRAAEIAPIRPAKTEYGIVCRDLNGQAIKSKIRGWLWVNRKSR